MLGGEVIVLGLFIDVVESVPCMIELRFWTGFLACLWLWLWLSLVPFLFEFVRLSMGRLVYLWRLVMATFVPAWALWSSRLLVAGIFVKERVNLLFAIRVLE